MSDLLSRLKAAGSIKGASVLSESSFFNVKEFVSTDYPIINCAFSGRVDGGMISGLTTIAGESKNYKSNMGLICVAAYLKHHKDAICLFYDSEFGITQDYIESQGIDADRVIHLPIEHIEQLKFDIVKRLDEIKRGDHVIIFIDSIGNLASVKESQDAMDEKTVADMSRAKSLKGLFRIITPHLTTKDIPCIAINHVYKEIGMFPKNIVGGGTGGYYSSNNIFIISRSQEKEGAEIVGWNFTLNIEKSRFVKEKSKLIFQVTYDGGIDKYSGLMDLGIEAGYIVKSGSRYQLVDFATGELGEAKVWGKDISHEFYDSMLVFEAFKEFVKKKYMLTSGREAVESV